MKFINGGGVLQYWNNILSNELKRMLVPRVGPFGNESDFPSLLRGSPLASSGTDLVTPCIEMP